AAAAVSAGQRGERDDGREVAAGEGAGGVCKRADDVIGPAGEHGDAVRGRSVVEEQVAEADRDALARVEVVARAVGVPGAGRLAKARIVGGIPGVSVGGVVGGAHPLDRESGAGPGGGGTDLDKGRGLALAR